MRVALVSGPDPGHLFPVVGLACALRASGHEVVVATGARWSAALATSGVGFVELPYLDAAQAGEGFGDRLSVRAAQMARPLAERLEAFGPDVMVSDTLTRAGGLAAGVLGLRWIELIPHNLPDPSVGLAPFGAGWAHKPLRDRLFRVLAAPSYRSGVREQRTAAATEGLRVESATQRLVATLPALEPPRPDWPDRTSVVGPLSWDPAIDDLPLPAGSDPLVLVVGSTASGSSDELLDRCLAQCEGSGIRVVSPRFSPYPGELRGWAAAGPGRLAPLVEAADVVVSTGGHGMVVAALGAGVPLVMVPGGGDQKEVAARVQRSGAGVVSPPDRLRECVFRILGDPAFATRAREVGACTGLPDPVALVTAAT